MREFQEYKNLTELKKSEELLQKRKEKDLPDLPRYDLFNPDPYFYYKSVENYKLLLKKIDDDPERKLTFFGEKEDEIEPKREDKVGFFHTVFTIW